MRWGRLLLYLILILPSAALAQSHSPITNVYDQICTVTGPSDINDILLQADQYDCSADKLKKATDYLWIIAPIGAAQRGIDDPVMRLRTSRHGAITIYRKFADDRILREHIPLSTMNEKWRSPYAIAVDLADDKGRKPDIAVIGIEKPWDPQNWQDIEILDRETDLELDQYNRQISALFTGLLFAPILLNFVIFIVIRQRFILFHSLMVAAILVNHISWTGQIFTLIPSATMADRSMIAHIALSLIGFGACMLMRDICDPKKLGKFFNSALLINSTTCMIITICLMVIAPALPLVGSHIFHFFFIIMTMTAFISLIYASLRGDKMAMLQLLGLSGAIIISILRVGRALGWWFATPVLDIEFNLAVMLELLTISYVVSLRAYQLRKSRDDAVQESKFMGQLAHHDSLTSILNRRGFMEQYERITAQSEKRNVHRALMILDVDKFKDVNDTYGHDAGDMVLVQLGELLKKICREDDIYARHGGEEFILIISSHQLDGIHAFAQRLRLAISENSFDDGNITLDQITVSIGIVHMDLERTRDYNIYYRTADKALYHAKNSGRNQIAYGELPYLYNATAEHKKYNPSGGAHEGSEHKKSGDDGTPAFNN